MKPALLVIDVQKQFFLESETQKESLYNAVYFINEAVRLFRGQKLPIVYIQHSNKEDGVLPGTEGFELPDAFDVQSEDIRVVKTYGNAFNKTSLFDKLKALGVDTVILSGYCAEFCVLSTYRGAKDLDLNPILLVGSLASGVPENIRFVESVSQVISLGALAPFIKALPVQ
jgi:nicotinamidase-related amidase